MTPSDPYEYIPPDVLEDIREAEKEIMPTSRRRKKPYPTNSDIADAIIWAVSSFYGHPDEFPDYVLKVLRSRGFETRHVTVKRIWRMYETLVRRRVIGDRLGVVV